MWVNQVVLSQNLLQKDILKINVKLSFPQCWQKRSAAIINLTHSMQSLLSENKEGKRSHLWIIMRVQNEICQSRAEMAFFCLFHWLISQGAKKNMAAISTSTPQHSLMMFHWLKKENNYCVPRASCTLVHFCVAFCWHNNRNLSYGNGNNWEFDWLNKGK